MGNKIWCFMQNYKLVIQYDGSRYYGWEHQPNQDTVQGELEKAVMESFGMREIPSIYGAGRTDAGVHAKGMVASMKLESSLSPAAIKKQINLHLPEDIAVLDVKTASANFHARYSAVGKHYRYTCHYGAVRNVFRRKYVLELEEQPDLEKMQQAARILVGKHDYAAFCKLSEGYSSTIRVVDEISIREQDGFYYFDFHGTGFMRNMVRILVGTLLEVGYGKIPLDEMNDILVSKERSKAGYTVAACGLCLMKVDY